MSEQNLKTICFDYSHNNNLVIESPSFADFTHFLFGSSFRLGKIQAGFTNLEKLNNYRMLVIGGPVNSELSSDEIEIIIKFVKTGGSLLVINGEGGDYRSGTNLSELTEHFGFEYNDDIMYDSLNYIKMQSRLKIDDFEPHIVFKNVDNIVLSKPCSLSVNDLIEADENIDLTPLIKTSLNSYHEYYNGEKWVENADAPRSILSLYVKYYEGRVIALPSLSMFSSLSSSYGFFAFDNQDFISNVFQFLLKDHKLGGDEKLINVQMNYSLFTWAEKLVQKEVWMSIDDILNFAVKYLKDNYQDVMKNLEERRKKLNKLRKEQLAKIKDKKERERQKKMLKSEEKIYESVERSDDSVKDLEDIMAGLSSITGGMVGKDFDINTFELEEEAEPEEEEAEPEEEEAEPEEEEAEPEEEEAEPEEEEEAEPEEEEEAEPEEEEEAEPEEKQIKRSERAHKEISASIKDEFNVKLKDKLKSNKSIKSTKKPKKKKPKRSQADEEIDEALAKLGSFDDFKKKLAEFHDLSDSDAPVSLVDEEDQKDKEKEKKEHEKITDDDIFA